VDFEIIGNIEAAVWNYTGMKLYHTSHFAFLQLPLEVEQALLAA
jgi:hypothetical protein